MRYNIKVGTKKSLKLNKEKEKNLKKNLTSDKKGGRLK